MTRLIPFLALFALALSNTLSAQEANNRFRYVVSAAVAEGTTETRIFNNLYTQVVPLGGRDFRATFFTTFVSSLYGLTDRLSVGLELRYRRVHYIDGGGSPLAVFSREKGGQSRDGLTTLGPKIRFVPFAHIPNLSVQSAFWFPLRNDWEGTADAPYLDWDRPTWWTQWFYDRAIGSKFSVFSEVDILWEDIGLDGDRDFNRLSIPVTLIGSYFPTPKWTVYVLGNVSPYITSNDGYFWQLGPGVKYQWTRNFELELLYTYFTNKYLVARDGMASTFNFGVRINR
jgi:hypothetical protein